MSNHRTDCPRCQREGVYAEEHYDARGIYICRACDDCWKEIKKGFRPEVLDDPSYECDEAIEEES